MSDYSEQEYDEDQEGVEEPELGDEEGGEDEAAEQEEEEKLPENPLTEDIVGECLSLLTKIGSGLAHAYVRLDVKDREVTDVAILSSFIHLRYVDLSMNMLHDISPLNSLTHLLTLKCERNLLQSAQLDELPYLQVASFSNNRITSTEGINHPLLESLNLSFNEISMVSGLQPSSLGRLHTLELRGNRLTTTAGIYLPNLKNLFLGGNLISKIEGLERMEHLTTLHLRDNKIVKLDGFAETMSQLQYINLRGNAVTDVKETVKMKSLPKLRALILSECPCSDEDDYRMEVLINLRRVERLDKDEYNDEERQEAEDLYEQRRAEELAAEGTEEVIHSDTEDA
ncbi:leucine-rich repeat-containing protein 23-like [Asterias rubens]|uniref:leucine-rich repeat-containing protein 23-like n=1 Tax=Asterias rubens TaxID=7604 RepID=UPI0014550446|nr:leucine-rich repeat-containing protein 23-like [Asterias rubens]